jgi:hypothetical protein
MLGFYCKMVSKRIVFVVGTQFRLSYVHGFHMCDFVTFDSVDLLADDSIGS